VDELLDSGKDSGDPMSQMKVCIKASERISGVIDRLQRFVASSVYPHFPELETLVYSKEQFIRSLDRMVHCVNPESLSLGKESGRG
jgi:RNA processing factor Prp31